MTNWTIAKRRIAVLGAGGFLGKNLVNHLATIGHEVLAIARGDLSNQFVSSRIRIAQADVADADFERPNSLTKLLRGIDVVYHFASSTNLTTNKDLQLEFGDTLDPLRNIIAASAACKVRKIIYPSSGSVYAAGELPRTEQSPTVDASAPTYAQAKLAAEALLGELCPALGIQATILRIGNPYGPKQQPRRGQGVIAYWLDAIARGESVTIRGDGATQRDYIFIEDTCQMLEYASRDLEHSELYNVGTGRGVSLNELLATLRQLLPQTISVIHQPAQATDVPSIALSPSKLLSRMPPFHFTSLREGLQQVIAAQARLDRNSAATKALQQTHSQ